MTEGSDTESCEFQERPSRRLRSVWDPSVQDKAAPDSHDQILERVRRVVQRQGEFTPTSSQNARFRRVCRAMQQGQCAERHHAVYLAAESIRLLATRVGPHPSEDVAQDIRRHQWSENVPLLWAAAEGNNGNPLVQYLFVQLMLSSCQREVRGATQSIPSCTRIVVGTTSTWGALSSKVFPTHHVKGRFPHHALEARSHTVRIQDRRGEVRGWKLLFCLMPMMFLRRSSSDGRVSKEEMCHRFNLFTSGEWGKLWQETLSTVRAQYPTRDPRKPLTLEQRAALACRKVKLGEVTRAMQTFREMSKKTQHGTPSPQKGCRVRARTSACGSENLHEKFEECTEGFCPQDREGCTNEHLRAFESQRC